VQNSRRHDQLFVAGLAPPAAYKSAPATPWVAARPASPQIRIGITPPLALPDDTRDAFLAVDSHRTVHNTLDHPPAVQIALESDLVAHGTGAYSQAEPAQPE
jgi:hypothetical protein